MTSLEPPLVRIPYTHRNSSSFSRPTTSNAAKAPQSPGPLSTSLPGTPDKERNTDPLSAHIVARTGTNPTTETPSFRRGLSELVTGKDKIRDEPAQVNHFAESEKKDKRKRVSFFAKLRGKEVSDDESIDVDDDLHRAEGCHVRTFARTETQKADHPTYIRVHSNNKPKRDFNNLFLAQELCDGQVLHDTASINSASATSSTGGALWSMKFSNDGKFLATGGQDRVVRVWRVLSATKDRQHDINGKSQFDSALRAPVFCAKPYREYQGHTSDVLDLSWSKNNFLLSSSMDKTVRLWHVSREECLCCFQHSDFVTSIAFHPKDDRYFLSGSLDCKLRLWDIKHKQVAHWNELPELITAVAFDPHGRIAIAGSVTGLCLFYETEGLRYHTQVHVKSSRGRNARGSKITGIQTMSLHPENPHSDVKILITSNDSRVRLYNLRDKCLELKFKGNENSCSQIRASFSDDCRYVICGSEDRHVYIWTAKDNPDSNNKDKRGYEYFEAQSNVVTAAIFAPSKSRQLLANSGDPIYGIVHKFAGRRSIHESETASIQESRKDLAAHDPRDGNIIICADYTGRIKIFRQDSAAPYRSKAEEKWEMASQTSKRTSNRGSVVSATIETPGQPVPKVEATSQVILRPHEGPIKTSPARNRRHHTAGKMSQGPPTMNLDGKVHRETERLHSDLLKQPIPEDTDNNDAFDVRNKSVDGETDIQPPQQHKREPETNPYLGPDGTSLGFYDLGNDTHNVVRPGTSRHESTASWHDMGQQAVSCARCGQSTFGATKIRDELRLECKNCGSLVV